ncbi:Methylamine utilisation protein MauE [Fontibacillus panacisegetis]|uniref:Methylamine utilisation protein MauE n=1 Tax=Fontibacillus panacisegetis TaxID=670482 RepID=A0A1G7NDF6_9BACL|nr:Methylamine utilisation protein MauE [Fontibacillus panacisegetis]
MNELISITQNLLAVVFLMSSLGKITNFTQHTQIIKAYRIVPNLFLVPSLIVFSLSELTISLTIFTFGITIYHTYGIVLLLCLYTLAIAFNLFRGHQDISCGCGGILEHERLNWGLVYRNVLLITIVIIIGIICENMVIKADVISKFALFLISISLYLTIYIYKKINIIRSKINLLLELLS